MRRVAAVVLAGMLGLLVLAGCSSASADPSPAGSSVAPTGSKSAWVRGTNVTLTNSSGSSVEYGTNTGDVQSCPEVPYSTLADGASASASDDWKSATSSGIFYRVKYPDGKVAEFLVANPAIGSPYVFYRTGTSVFDWEYGSGYDRLEPDEGTSATVTVAGHSITFNYMNEDDDFKNWTVTLG